MDSFPVFLIHSFSEHRRVVTKPKQANTCWSEKKFCFLVYLSQLLRIKSNSMSNESSPLLWYQQLLHRKTLLFHSKSSVFVFSPCIMILYLVVLLIGLAWERKAVCLSVTSFHLLIFLWISVWNFSFNPSQFCYFHVDSSAVLYLHLN